MSTLQNIPPIPRVAPKTPKMLRCPKDYLATLIILKHGQEVVTDYLKINQPEDVSGDLSERYDDPRDYLCNLSQTKLVDLLSNRPSDWDR